MKKLSIALLLIAALEPLPSLAQIRYSPPGTGLGMNTSAGNAVLPTARTNMHLLHFVSPYDYGAKCDGVTDDSVALTNWFNAGSSTVGLIVPNATCAFATALSLSSASNIFITGGGPYQSVLLYTGATTTNDLVALGNATTGSTNLYLSEFRLASNTTMTNGAGLHLINVGSSALRDITIDGQYGNGKLWNGIWFDRIDEAEYSGTNVRAQNDAVRVNGTVGAGLKADLSLESGKILSSAVGVHVGGAFGGLYLMPSLDIIANGTNLLIDHALANEANREIFDWAVIDSATGDNIKVNDSSASNATLQINNWVASAGAYGLDVVSGGWNISINNGPVFNGASDGIFLASGNTSRINIGSGTQIHNNTGYGINAGSAVTVYGDSSGIYSNTAGTLGANVTLAATFGTVASQLNVTNTTVSTSSTTGAVVVSGGLAVGGAVNVGSPSKISTAAQGTILTIANGSAGTDDQGAQILLTNTGSGITAPNKYIRIDHLGELQILNSGYTTGIITIGDNGGMQIGSPSGGNVGASILNTIAGGIYDNGTAPTGTGAYVHATSPTLVTPTLGAAMATSLTAVGTAPTASGTCTVGTQVGGNTAGSFVASAACAAGTVVLTFATTAPHDWRCTASDATTPADTLNQTNTTASTTSCTFTATMALGDLVRFNAVAF